MHVIIFKSKEQAFKEALSQLYSFYQYCQLGFLWAMKLNVNEEITCKRQNHSFLPKGKYTSQALYQTLQKKQCYFGFYFLVRVSKTSYSSAIVALFASAAGILPVINSLNQDTTVYYGVVFWAFS